MSALSAASAFLASAFVAFTAHGTTSDSPFAIDFSLDDLRFTDEEIARDLFDQFERLGS